ncbi:MAG: hypothetical protein R3D44_10450 [Hyphomicrobiaceae bacterium]
MPPLIAAMLVGAGAYAGARALKRILAGWSDSGDVRATTGTPDASTVVEKDLGALELDPVTGVYRPARPT